MVFIRLPVAVSNRLKAGQSEIFTEFRLKSSVKPIESIWCFRLEMFDHPKKYYFGFTFDQFTELVYTAKVVRLSVTDSNRLRLGLH